MNLLKTFNIGMDRQLAEFKEPPEGRQLNVGAGKKQIEDADPIDYPGWIAGTSLPVDTGTVAQIYAFHFLEHLDVDDLVRTLREFERVLMVGGLVNIVVPFWDSELAHQDFDHKTFWSETSLRQLFFNTYYDGVMEHARYWKFQINAVVIMGIVQRNLAVLAQIERTYNVPG